MSRSVETVSQALLPALALRGVVVFPHVPLSFEVHRPESVAALHDALQSDKQIFLVTQRDAAVKLPAQNDLYAVGVIARIKQSLRLPDKQYRVVVEGSARAELCAMSRREKSGAMLAQVLKKEVEVEPGSVRAEALMRAGIEQFEQYIEFLPKVSSDILLAVQAIKNPGALADFIAANVLYKFQDKQAVLDEFDPLRRLELLSLILEKELNVLRLEENIAGKVKARMDQNQRDYFLREQMKVIQDELGGHDEYSESEELIAKIEKAKLPAEFSEKLKAETEKLSRMPFGSAESGVIRNYIDTCLEIPFSKRTKDRLDLGRARKILDADHDGLSKVKDRILEYLAVKSLAPGLKGQILCLVGPPGVGKTSVGASIARTLGRKYVRLSLGGVRDEADIRGHRKTYIGSMPGRFINALKQAGSMNPLIVMDEIDKLAHDAHGDPASALLEVLDPEQNHAFRDHFIELPVDLSDCIFIATANRTDTIPRALLDRVEVIELPGYTQGEKLQIARHHLIKKQRARHGLSAAQLSFSDAAVLDIIEYYTREQGVRNLERAIARICRKAARAIASKTVKKMRVKPADLQTLLGKKQFRREAPDLFGICGVAGGLAWTETGGEMLKVEVLSFAGTGKLELTGSLGDVMKESAKAAVSLIRAHTERFGIKDPQFYKNCDLHIHLPEGAVPKDGPSAGITLVCALVSELSARACRTDLAMTGEITLRGKVLPVGGLREKLSAAACAGITTVILPKENMDSLDEVDPVVLERLQLVPVSDIHEVIHTALAPIDAQGESAPLIPPDALPRGAADVRLVQ